MNSWAALYNNHMLTPNCSVKAYALRTLLIFTCKQTLVYAEMNI